MPAPSRSLTSGERDLAASVFGNAIDYDQVRLVRRAWWPFQPKNIVMAPCGNIHFHRASDLWSDDFASEALHPQGLFIHEMTHVWQAQLRGKYYLPLMRHPFCKYRYEFRPGRPFDRYGLEQQAEIVRHVFLLSCGRSVPGNLQLETLASILPFASNCQSGFGGGGGAG
jgi:hypothetical protein